MVDPDRDEPDLGASGAPGPILTLEPLLDTVRAVVEAGGWELSGLQKTTSYEYGGRWDGDSTRSAYAFFHPASGRGEGWSPSTTAPGESARASGGEVGSALDVFLDETNKGLTGTLALVLVGPTLNDLGDVEIALSSLAAVARECVSSDQPVRLSLKAGLADARRSAGSATVDVRFKFALPTTAILAGERVVRTVVRSALDSFDIMIRHPDLAARLAPE